MKLFRNLLVALMMIALVAEAGFALPLYAENPGKILGTSTDMVLYVAFCDSYVTLREWPYTSAQALERLDVGDKVYWDGGYNDDYGILYLYVRDDYAEGWVQARYLAARGDLRVEPHSYTRIDNVQEYASLREKHDMSSRVIARMPLAAEVFVIGECSGNMSKVVYNGMTGYVMTTLLHRN